MHSAKFSPDWLRERRFALLIGSILGVLYLSLFAFKGYFEINLQTFVGDGTYFKVYWAGPDQPYSESRSKKVRIAGGDYKLKMFIGNMGRIGRLRIDPVEYPGEALIKSVSLSQVGYRALSLDPVGLTVLQPLAQIDSIEPGPLGIRVTTVGRDGNLEWRISPERTGEFPWIHPLNVLLILIACLVLARGVDALAQRHNYVVAALLVASALATTMAVVSNIHVHPDERVHLEAVKYYGKHWLPPSLDSPEIERSFSDYGKSRLSTYEPYYPLAGYFTRLLSPLKVDDLISARAFSVLLLMGLTLMAVARSRFRYFAIPLIISPQVWYLYSYPNSDVFGLTLALFFAYQLAVSDSLLNRFLSEERPRHFLLLVAGFGLLAGALLLSKVNFWFFLLFLFLYLLWRLRLGYYADWRRLASRIAMLVMVGLVMGGVRFGLDYMQNGPDPRGRFLEYVELKAKPEFKPSTPMEDKHNYLYLRQRGQELDVVMNFLGWGPITFATAFGSYGYTQYFGSDEYFAVVKWLVFLLLGAMVFYALVRGPGELHGLIFLAGLCAVLLMAASIWSSWNENFQAQGRYLAPILPMISVVYYHLRHYMNPRIIAALALSLFALGVYSFVFIGLGRIAKTGYYTAVG